MILYSMFHDLFSLWEWDGHCGMLSHLWEPVIHSLLRHRMRFMNSQCVFPPNWFILIMMSEVNLFYLQATCINRFILPPYTINARSTLIWCFLTLWTSTINSHKTYFSHPHSAAVCYSMTYCMTGEFCDIYLASHIAKAESLSQNHWNVMVVKILININININIP